jgi:hypothetical protein
MSEQTAGEEELSGAVGGVPRDRVAGGIGVGGEALLYVLSAPFAHEHMKSRRRAYSLID